MRSAAKIILIFSIALMLLWLYIVNCQIWDRYEFVYSENDFTQAWQRIAEFFWGAFTMFGWLLWIGVIILMLFISFPKLFETK